MPTFARNPWGALLVALSSFGAAACNALADPGIEYGCFRPAMPYEEHFDGKYEGLLDVCWEAKGSGKDDIAIGESDLVIGHGKAASWDAAPPRFVQRLEGDFVVVTKVEAISGSRSNFCDMTEGDSAGLVVTGGTVDAAFLVRPYLEEPGDPARTCQDDSDYPPSAIAAAHSTGRAFDPVLDQTPGIGSDGEGDIAVCRRRGNLSYHFRHPSDPGAAWQAGDWEQLGTTDDVGEGTLDVGIATTLSQEGVDLGLSVEGHFNWTYLTDLSDDCTSPLEALEEPEPE